jgi:pimeloyl-ACP methyl ester carboxylesterase
MKPQPPNAAAGSEEKLQLRLHGPDDRPVLIYFPGLHGDWTLVGSFRRALGKRVRFVEMTYPRTLAWSLDDYAAAIEAALANEQIGQGWLLGESFGSQLVWALLQRSHFNAQGVILAGGFVQHPVCAGVRFAEKCTGSISLGLVTRILFAYARIARFRYRHAPEVREGINDFIARRTELDRQAAKHRLHLIAENDPCAIVRELRVPTYALSGLIDPIVPWYFVRRWLERNCPALREYRILRGADHNVLGTAPDESARLITTWMNASAP